MGERRTVTVPDLVGQPVVLQKSWRRTLGWVSQPGILMGRGCVPVHGRACSG